jgi:hypothetical protein
MNLYNRDETLAYHAARILLLVRFCGKPQHSKTNSLPGVKGRTLLAKIDFFLRYPYYLKQAAEVRGKQTTLKRELSDESFGLQASDSALSVESQMVRYLYGPWDHVYYSVLAYLIGKGLIEIHLGKRQTEVFRLTSKGLQVAEHLSRQDAYSDLVQRAETVYYLFNSFSGTRLKNFIYDHFPEVVNRAIGSVI